MIVDPKFYGIAKAVIEDIDGRAADGGTNLPPLGKVIAMAGPGDHIEIGTLFGASAIMAALVKKDAGLAGQIYCVDPFGPRDDIRLDENKVDKDAKEANLDAVLENFSKFGVSDRMIVVPQSSQPWPEDLKDHRFTTGFIDGKHDQGFPWRDFIELRDRVQRFLMFDNFEEIYPDVVTAGIRAMTSGGWFLHYKEGNFLSLRRPFTVKDKDKEWRELRAMSAI